jgi:hypothetical protein
MERLGFIGSRCFPLRSKRPSSRKSFVLNTACPENRFDRSGRQERASAGKTRHFSRFSIRRPNFQVTISVLEVSVIR